MSNDILMKKSSGLSSGGTNESTSKFVHAFGNIILTVVNLLSFCDHFSSLGMKHFTKLFQTSFIRNCLLVAEVYIFCHIF